MKKLIELKNACKNYYAGDNKIVALKNVNLDVEQGEFISIVGASGSGKSTLMNCLGCLDSIDSGEYFLDGIDITKQNDNELSLIRNKKIGFIFQGFNLISGLTALENVELPLIYRGIKSQKAKEIALLSLERVNLIDRIMHKPTQMSGGQQQRVAIARA
ncbi:MAG: ABC transporter ATP-binding protein, partial [Oscillospiraceae bacterium]